MAEPEFFSQPWADAVREAINAGPTPEYRATKLDMYWDWIALVAADFSGSLAIGVRDYPGEGDESFVVLQFDGGACARAAPAGREEAFATTFALVGTYDDWKSIMAGYDTNKAVMYRKLALEVGDVYDFFRRAYFFTEILAALAKISAALPTDVAA